MTIIKMTRWSLILAMLSLWSCTKDFEAINTNPNAPATAQPELLLRRVIYNYGDEMSYEGFVAGNLLAQHFTMVDFNLFDRHDLSSPQLGGNPWPVIYQNLLDNEQILDQALSDPSLSVYEGPARILKAYMSATLTDLYGDVPYREALKGNEGNVAPAYDSQQDIYSGEAGILQNLELGITAIQNYAGTQTLEGDILFNGYLADWVAFANSLRIKYLMRISAKQDVSETLQTIYDEGNYMLVNAQNAVFNFTSGPPNSFRMQQLRDGDFNLFVLSSTMEQWLKRYNDPRINTLFRPIGNDSNQATFKGLLNGPDASQTSISINDFSLPGSLFRESTDRLDANFMTAWETHFFLAEAAEKGLISANAQSHYETAVAQAFEYWQTPMPSTYLSTDSAAFGANGANKLEQILTQKWIANSINGYEGWIEYRRTGFPMLQTVSASLNNDLIPVRMPYPADEAALNQRNFNNATETNQNSVNDKVWWDE